MFPSLLTIATLLVTALAHDKTSPIKSFALNGSGCPPGSFRAVNAGNSVYANFSDFRASVGYGVEPLDQRQNCQATITVAAYPGYRVYPAKTVYTAYFNLRNQVFATRTSQYYFQGSNDNGQTTNYIAGPSSENGVYTDSFGNNGPKSDCGEVSIVNINLAVALNNGPTSNAGTGTVTDARFGNFVFERC